MTTKDKTSDPRFIRSLEALVEAATSLVDLYPISEISITRIVEAAGVTRPTFYQHFTDVASVAQHAALVRLATAFPFPDPAGVGGCWSLEQQRQRVEHRARPVLEHLLAHRPFYRRILDEGAGADFFEGLIAFVEARLLSDRPVRATGQQGASSEDVATVIAGGMTWLVVRWIRSQAGTEGPKAMARRIAAVATTVMAPDSARSNLEADDRDR